MDDFLARYPEFAKLDKSRISLALSDAALELSERVWGKLYPRGLMALAAHLLFVGGALTASGSNNGKPVQFATSKAAGGLSIGYSSPDAGFSTNHEGMALTTYGQEYLRLRKLTARHMLVVR